MGIEMEMGEHSQTIPGTGFAVNVYDKGVTITHAPRKGEDPVETLMIRGPFSIEKVHSVDGHQRFVWSTDKRHFGDFREMLRQLHGEGRIAEHRWGQQTLVTMIQDHVGKHGVESGAPSFFHVGLRDGEFVIPQAVFGEHPDQRKVWEALEPHMGREVTKKDWDKYLEFERLFEPHEILVVKAMCALAPFTYFLRSQRKIVPGIMALSSQPGTGKSAVTFAYSVNAWKRDFVDAESINTLFRFGIELSAASIPLAIDDAEGFLWDKFGSKIKGVFGSKHARSMGTGKGSNMDRFQSAAPILMSANSLSLDDRTALARFLILLFDEKRVNASKKWRNDVKRLMESLPPVGPELMRVGADIHTPDHLMKTIAGNAEKIERIHGPFETDNRRAEMWGMMYTFLDVWSHASHGVHRTPNLRDFVKTVVVPVERAGLECIQDALTRLRSWVEYKYKTRRFGPGWDDGDKEEDADEKEKRLGPQNHMFGDHPVFWIDRATLDAYNDEMSKKPALQIKGLPAVAKRVAATYNKPENAFFRNKGAKVREWRFGTRTMPAVPVPQEDPEQVSKR